MPLGPCRHILKSRGLVILPSFLSSASSSGDCLTTSHGFLIVFVGEASSTFASGTASLSDTGLPFRRTAEGAGTLWPFVTVARVLYCRKIIAPFGRPIRLMGTPLSCEISRASPASGWLEILSVERSTSLGRRSAIFDCSEGKSSLGPTSRRKEPSRPRKRSIMLVPWVLIDVDAQRALPTWWES